MLIRDIVIIVGTYSNFKAFGDCNVWLKILKLGQNYKMVVDPRQIQKNKLRNGKKGTCMAIIVILLHTMVTIQKEQRTLGFALSLWC